MQRADALIGLSHDHHQALVVASRLNKAQGTALQEYWCWVRSEFAKGLLDHFQAEEQGLLPLLDAEVHTGERMLLQQRLRTEHQQMREFLSHDDLGAAAEFAALLKAHVRFEERELFPWLEQHFSESRLRVALNPL